MTKNEASEYWYSMMERKLGTDREGVREYMRQNQKKSMESRTGKHRGGFNVPGVAKAANKKSHEVRWKKNV